MGKNERRHIAISTDSTYNLIKLTRQEGKIDALHNKHTAIVADDNTESAVYMSVVLGRMNFNVLPLPDGRDVVKMARDTHPDIIFLDREMPDPDGIKTLMQLREDPATSGIPVSVMALREDREGRDKLAELGVDMVLDRPVDPQQLHEIVSSSVKSPYKVKRRYLRVNTDKKVFMIYNDRLKSYNAVSLSERGMFVREAEPMAVGTHNAVVIPLDGGERLLLNGTIIYTKDMYGKFFDTGPGMALEFRNISDKESGKLRRYISCLIEKGVA